jgi:hypothetical protein
MSTTADAVDDNAKLTPKVPHSVEAEQSVIGALLIDNGVIDRIGELRAEHFYRADHRVIFSEIISMSAAGIPADALTVYERLDAKGHAAEVGGRPYLNEIVQNTPGTANVRRYADIVLDRAHKRQLLSVTSDVQQAIRSNPAGDSAAVLAARAAAQVTALAPWNKPEPLPNALLPVEPFDFELMPEALRPWVRDVVERIQCPPDFVGVTVMAALGVVIGRRVGIRPKRRDDWTEYGNQWACLIGRPGVLKSPAMTAALTPLYRLEDTAARHYAAEKLEYDAEAQIHAMRLDSQRKSVARQLADNPAASVDLYEPVAGPIMPTMRRYLVNDTTCEALLEICRENPQGVGAYRDELVSLLQSLDRDGQEGARGFYLTGWNGNQPYVADRIGRGRNLRAEAVCLSVLGSTQPGRIAGYIRAATHGGVADDGLIQRFGLLVYPDVTGAWCNVDRPPDGDAQRKAFGVFARLNAADPLVDWQAEPVMGYDDQPVCGQPPFVRFDEAATEHFLEWRIGFESGLRSGHLHPAVESHLAKYRKLVPSLALLCHLADGGKGPVNDSAMLRALAWAHYLQTHAERAYASGTGADLDSAKALLGRIRHGDVDNRFTARDIYRHHWSMLQTPEDVGSALNVLSDYGWVRAVSVATDGRTKTVFEIHPDARS